MNFLAVIDQVIQELDRAQIRYALIGGPIIDWELIEDDGANGSCSDKSCVMNFGGQDLPDQVHSGVDQAQVRLD